MRRLNKIIIAAAVVLSLFSILPQSAEAAVPVFETNPILTGVLPLDIPNLAEMTFEWAFKMAVEILRRQLLNMIVDQIVAWIQGGGTPRFITDWNGFFADAIDQAGGKFLQRINLGQLCSAFGPKLSAAFIPIPTFSERTSCTLSRVGANLDAFLKDFRKGNWIAWEEMVLRPQNNVYGAYVMAWDQYEIEKSAAAKAAAAETQAGRGFLSAKRCVKPAYSYETRCTAYDDNDQCKSYTSEFGGSKVQVGCDKWETVTPGLLVGELAAKAVGSDIDYIVSAQELKVYIAAISNAILNRIFAEGVGLLHSAFSGGGGGGSGGGGGNNTSSASQCAPLIGTAAYTDCVKAVQSGIDIREFQKNNLMKLIDQDLIYQNQLFGAEQATLAVLNQSTDILNQLKTCQGSESPALSQTKNDAKTISDQITKIQSDIVALQMKQQEIKSVTDITLIPSLYAKVAGVVNPAATQSLALSAQQETAQKQQAMNSYQQQLTSCQQQQ